MFMISKTEFRIMKMDCPSEEQLIRMKLQNFDNIKLLEFDIPNRKLNVYHYGNAEHIIKTSEQLNLSTTLITTEEKEDNNEEEDKMQNKLLWKVLIINISFFRIELLYRLVSVSRGLKADSLDMLADSIVY